MTFQAYMLQFHKLGEAHSIMSKEYTGDKLMIGRANRKNGNQDRCSNNATKLCLGKEAT